VTGPSKVPPSKIPVRENTPRDPKAPPARGTRGAGYGTDLEGGAAAPAGAWSEGAEASVPAPAPAAKAPAPAPKAPAPTASSPGRLVAAPAPGRTVPKSVAPAPKPPVPTPFPPEELRAEVEALLARYPERIAALIPILHLAQAKMGGWISPELEAGIATFLGCSDQHVRGVVTFYTMFNTKPVGRHHVQVCRTLSCWLRGAGGLTACLKQTTGLAPGQTDDAKRFTVSEVECLGLCEVAPALFVNDVPYGNVTPASLKALLDTLP
jgi:NADH-quinone oxidoreductase subunit E